jgi:pimeloyl-ACP methyl ester carboxylesterase
MTAGLLDDMTLDGLTVHSRRWVPTAPRPDATPVLLVHGLGANTVAWVTVGQAIADRLGAAVTAIDLAGFGYTRSIGTEATVERNARLVIAALEHFGPSVVIGNSMGGAITVKVAGRRADLVRSMVLVNPAVRPARLRSPQNRNGLFMFPMLVPPLGERLVAGRAAQLGPETLVDQTLQLVLEDPGAVPADVRDDLVKIAADRMEFPEAPRAYADAAGSLFWYMTRNLDRDLRAALPAVPGLMVFGSRDRLVDVSSARALADRHPALDVHYLDDLGHAPHLEAPDRFVDAIDAWLDGR